MFIILKAHYVKNMLILITRLIRLGDVPVCCIAGAAEPSTSRERDGCDLTGVRPKAADAAILDSAACSLVVEAREVWMVPALELRCDIDGIKRVLDSIV